MDCGLYHHHKIFVSGQMWKLMMLIPSNSANSIALFDGLFHLFRIEFINRFFFLFSKNNRTTTTTQEKKKNDRMLLAFHLWRAFRYYHTIKMWMCARGHMKYISEPLMIPFMWTVSDSRRPHIPVFHYGLFIRPSVHSLVCWCDWTNGGVLLFVPALMDLRCSAYLFLHAMNTA